VETEPVASREDVEQAAATWIARRDGDAWTAADAASLQQWLAESAGHRAAYYRLNSAWSEAGRVRALGGPMQAQ
jgi:transmembrane sensor